MNPRKGKLCHLGAFGRNTEHGASSNTSNKLISEYWVSDTTPVLIGYITLMGDSQQMVQRLWEGPLLVNSHVPFNSFARTSKWSRNVFSETVGVRILVPDHCSYYQSNLGKDLGEALKPAARDTCSAGLQTTGMFLSESSSQLVCMFVSEQARPTSVS